MADAARAIREVDRRPVAVPSSAAATKPRSEGLALTISAEERARFIAAAERFDRSRPGTEERFLAMKDFLPLFRATHRRLSLKSAEKDATDEDRERHRAVVEKIKTMVEELREGCSSHRYELRHIAFRVLAETKFVGEITTIAERSKHEDMREAAFQYLVDDIARTIGTTQNVPATATRTFTVDDDGNVAKVIPFSSVTSAERKQAQEMVARKKDALLDLGLKAWFSDTRQKIAEYFANAGDVSRLEKMKAEIKYPDTRILLGDLLARMDRNAATTAQLVERCITDHFGGGKPERKGDDIALPPIVEIGSKRRKPPSDGAGDMFVPPATGTDNYATAQA
ncbi:Uncharacterised protein [Candidatus Bilamarchaeum dharawalense]|uniref:Uncharacterized protein n=1 Tax=Candidatus Bilamarchaeum dharawalense TaxID=2885759 RepID=A0A5E4LPB0_9ARCH|nr:Uncharacterised protein [Candidatus Bilamarchaeum dharawalense]